MARQYDVRIPVTDNHCHVCFPQPIDDSLRDYEQLFQKLSIQCAGLLSCPASSHNGGIQDIAENLKTLYLKDRLSIPCYAYAGFTWHWAEPEPYAEFAAQMLDMGFDGFKALEMHPRVRRLFGKGLNHPSYKRFFDLINRRGCTMVCHVGDPRPSWNMETAAPEAVRLGRVYANGFLSLDELYDEMEEVIAQYPNINFVLAHFYFMSDSYERVCRLLDEHPNVCLDLTPGGEMYVNFTKDLELWRAFFLRYSTRLLLGSDHYPAGHGEVRYDLARNFLEGTEPFEYFGSSITPICLPREALENIYRNNIRRLIGAEPKPVHRSLAYDHCRYILDECSGQLTAQGRENIEIIAAYWESLL